MGATKIIIVNEDDRIIGYKERGKIESHDIYRVSALWLTNSQGQFLLAQRSFNKKNNPGCWATAVAGTVEEGESYQTNIYKEIDEELGLKNVTLQIGPKQRITSGKHNHFTQWYLLNLDKKISEFAPAPEEIEKIQWFSKEEFYRAYTSHPSIFLQHMPEYVELLNN